METETFIPPSSNPPPPWGQPPENSPPGLRPNPDPTRSGAVWVGGAGVAMLLAAAAVLTAVRWDDIGQSMKLGGLALITAALLAAGQRFKDTIPMTARAIFHLGALLIPFDMAAVAILAGRSWQETLLLTSVTSVAAWYGIGRAQTSNLLRVSAAVGVGGVAAGVAAVSGLTMPLVLAIAGVVALASRQKYEAVAWGLAAGVLPLGAVVQWPTRIAGAMADLGFESSYREQLLAAGILSVLTIVGVAKAMPHPEIAWSAIAVGCLTALLGVAQFTHFADVGGAMLWLACILIGLELLALAVTGDPLWSPVLKIVVPGAETIAGLATALVALAMAFDLTLVGQTAAAAVGLSAVGWLIADYRRLDGPTDWLTGLLLGSGWVATTVFFPLSILTMLAGFDSAPLVLAIAAVALAYWMVATWRPAGAYGAIALVGFAAVCASFTGPWTELAVGAAAAVVLMYGTRLRLRSDDPIAALLTGFVSLAVWLASSMAAVASEPTSWPLALVLTGAWALSWLAEAPTATPGVGSKPEFGPNAAPVIGSMGRGLAGVLLISSLWVEPTVALGLCVITAALASIDYMRASQAGAKIGSVALVVPVVAAGVAVGLAGIPIAGIVGLASATSGAAMAVAGFVLVGLALVAPREVDLALGAAAVVTTLVGLARAFDDPAMLALAAMAAGCAALLAATALRDMVIAVTGYVVVGLGFSLQLAVWDVTWLEPYLIMPAIAALLVGRHWQLAGASSWATYAPTIALLTYVPIAERVSGGPAWHTVIAGAVAVVAIVFGGYRKLAGPLITGSVALAVAAGYECLGPAALVPTWAWLAAGGSVLLAAGVALERSDSTPLERGQQLRSVIATQYT